MGGAVFNHGGLLTAVNTTFTANEAIGGQDMTVEPVVLEATGLGPAILNLNGRVSPGVLYNQREHRQRDRILRRRRLQSGVQPASGPARKPRRREQHPHQYHLGQRRGDGLGC